MRGLRWFAEALCSQHGVPDGTRYRYLGPRYRNLGPSRPIVSQETSKRPPGAILDPSGRPWRPENTIKYKVFAAFHLALQTPARTPKSAPGRCQNDPQEAQEQPGTPQEAPGAAQDGLRRPQEPPGAPQERPRSLPNSASWRPWRPNGVHLAAQEPSGGLRSTNTCIGA